jgi:ribosome-associated protein
VDSLALHRAERWRAELIASDDALTEWMASHPDADAQQMRTLVRNARKESHAEGSSVPAGVAPRKGRAFRDLFQFIREAERG